MAGAAICKVDGAGVIVVGIDEAVARRGLELRFSMRDQSTCLVAADKVGGAVDANLHSSTLPSLPF